MYSAQQLLDQLHEINLPELFTTPLSDKDRIAKLKLAKQQLKRIKQLLRQEQKSIKSKWGRKAYELEQKKIELVSYELVEMTIADIEVSLVELDTAIQTKQPLPQPPDFGTIITEGMVEGNIYQARLTTNATLEKERIEREQQQRAEIHQKLEQARSLIASHHYDAARSILTSVDHSKAREWLAKIDEITNKKARRLRNYVLAATASVLLVCSSLFALTSSLGSSALLPTVAALPSVTMVRPTVTKLNNVETSAYAPEADKPTQTPIVTTTSPSDTPTITPTATITPSKIPTASAKAEADRVKLLRRKFKGIEHLTGTGEIRAYPSTNKEDFIVSIEAFLDIFGEAELIANSLKTRTIQVLGFTPNKFTILIFNGYWLEKYELSGTKWTVDRLYDDNRINILVTTATYLAPTATRYIPPTDIPIVESYPTYTVPTLDYSYIIPTTDPSSGGSSSGATALCNDGTLSYSANHRGTCSHHGGVAVWYK